MFCLPIGEHTEVPLADLVNNAAVQYLLTKPTSKPRWCLRKAPHDVTTCTFLHRMPEVATGYVTVRGEPAPVAISDLLQNKGLEAAIAHPETFAEWCSVAAPHEVATCKNIHLGEVKNDKTVLVEGEETPVNVSHLLLNRGVSFLLSSRAAKGVWCNNKIVHDVLSCPYIHRRIDDHPQVVNVDGEKFPVPVKDLVPNKGLEFLLENPQYSGRWCSLFERHEPEECGYLHRTHPYVRVDGELIRVGLLRANRGLKYVLEHPEAHGHWCRSKHDEAHPIETCTFIHYKDEIRDMRARPEIRRNADRSGRDRGRDSRPMVPRGRGGLGWITDPPMVPMRLGGSRHSAAENAAADDDAAEDDNHTTSRPSRRDNSRDGDRDRDHRTTSSGGRRERRGDRDRDDDGGKRGGGDGGRYSGDDKDRRKYGDDGAYHSTKGSSSSSKPLSGGVDTHDRRDRDRDRDDKDRDRRRERRRSASPRRRSSRSPPPARDRSRGRRDDSRDRRDRRDRERRDASRDRYRGRSPARSGSRDRDDGKDRRDDRRGGDRTSSRGTRGGDVERSRNDRVSRSALLPLASSMALASSYPAASSSSAPYIVATAGDNSGGIYNDSRYDEDQYHRDDRRRDENRKRGGGRDRERK